MSYLDDEIARIEKYVQGLGITLRKLTKVEKNQQKSNAGTWSPNEIDIYMNVHKTKIELILTLLHEIGHHLHYMHNDKPEIPNEYTLDHNSLTKVQRRKILDYEKCGISLMPTIAIELGLKIPMWKIYLQTELDIWVYEHFYENGSYPSMKERKLKKQSLTKLYKGKKI